MKNFYLFLLLFISFSCFADEVPADRASQLAANFYRLQNGMMAESFQLVQQEVYNGRALFYVFQMNEDDGFVIVSGDDQTIPVLGYALNGTYIYEEQAPQFKAWMDNYRDQLVYIVNNDIPATQEIYNQWADYSDETKPATAVRAGVGPLVQLGWDQGNFYNADCPFSTQYNARTVTGCVATAMAMIMKYWNYPAQGSGFHSYNTQSYGTLSANFGSTSYNWGSMPSQVLSNNPAVAELMYQCGVSVEMSYGVSQTGGSGAYVVNAASPIQHCSEYAYKTYFGYDASSVSGILRDSYSDAQWINTLKTELDESRPMQYAGIGSGGGHTWVLDGYDDNNLFHMNWGWSNQNDGYYALNALNPSTLGAGGGAGGFNSNQQVIIGIKPPGGGGGGNPPPPASVSISSGVFIYPGNTIDFASAFDVYCNVSNTGGTSITADFAAVLLNGEGYVIDFIQTFNNQTLNGNSTVDATFSTSGLLATPGNYFVAVIFKQGSGNWQLVQPANGQANPTFLTILGPYNYIQLYSNMVLSPTQFVSGQPASVNVNLYNDGFFDWYGTYAAALYDLEGNYVTTIAEINENQGLPPGFVYNPPYLTFSTNNLDVAPGTYILAMMGIEQGTSDYYLLGGSQFTNPITITVAGPPINPDMYENNNTVSNAYPLQANFSGNNLVVSTTGSSIHEGSDIDYYTINLPAGFSYLVTPRLHDSFNSGNGNTYTVDGLFTWDIGNGLSPAIDDVAPEAITLPNGGTITFKVSPYFTGNTGTYLLELNMSRSVLGIEDDFESVKSLTIYPNPTENNCFIYLPEEVKSGTIRVYDALGKIILTELINNTSSPYLLNTEAFANGVYIIEMEQGTKKSYGKLIRK